MLPAKKSRMTMGQAEQPGEETSMAPTSAAADSGKIAASMAEFLMVDTRRHRAYSRSGKVHVPHRPPFLGDLVLLADQGHGAPQGRGGWNQTNGPPTSSSLCRGSASTRSRPDPTSARTDQKQLLRISYGIFAENHVCSRSGPE